ncbi:unnamed protein product [Lactuca virosa]|uniref:Uncharacterized protein n=1 Tax=Lactuca virosa TaxID=75947 RepID=A0AAU9MY25_9ASTR|nr:unnamed protein product [Lactuca virosa]
MVKDGFARFSSLCRILLVSRIRPCLLFSHLGRPLPLCAMTILDLASNTGVPQRDRSSKVVRRHRFRHRSIMGSSRLPFIDWSFTKLCSRKGDIRTNNLKPEGQRSIIQLRAPKTLSFHWLNCEWKENKYRSGRERREIDAAFSLVKVDLQNSQNELATLEQQKSGDKMLKLVDDMWSISSTMSI